MVSNSEVKREIMLWNLNQRFELKKPYIPYLALNERENTIVPTEI